VDKTYDQDEGRVLMTVFMRMLEQVTRDGAKKRAGGLKPPWWLDYTHEAAIFSHLNKWKHGEVADRDSGAHPLVHLAWRALAIAYQDIWGPVDPRRVLETEEKHGETEASAA
jgi:hypothetical protein